jgi:hypothetical protein
MRTSPLAVFLAASMLSSAAWAQLSEPQVLTNLAASSPAWDSPGLDAAGSMPIGNGQVGANVWVEASGDLVLLLSHTDSFSECERLLKLGQVRIACQPPLETGSGFSQRLDLEKGTLEIRTSTCTVRVLVDAGSPTLHVRIDSTTPRQATAALEVWRTKQFEIVGREHISTWLMHEAPASIKITESPDVIDPIGDALLWYHRNETSMVPFTLNHQGLSSVASTVKDPLLHRTFGGHISGDGFTRIDATTLRQGSPSKEASLRIRVACEQADDVAAWKSELVTQAKATPAFEIAAARTHEWWKRRWLNSYVFIEPGQQPAPLRNNHPIRTGIDSNGQNKFTGQINAGILTRVLEASEIAAIAANPAAAWPEGIIACPPAIGGQRAAPQVVQDAASFTILARIKPERASQTGRIFDKLTAGTSDGALVDLQHGKLRAIVGATTVQTTFEPPIDRETMVAIVVDAGISSPRLYANGTLLQGEVSGAARRVPTVSEAYAVQRYMTTAATRGAFPVKFNGSIFTVPPVHVDGNTFNPDFRNWGGSYWWQNTRLPYHGMLARGDGDLLASLFDFYITNVPVCSARAKLYYNAAGVYFPETMTTFGTYANADYGWDRTGKEPSEVQCQYWRYAWNQGPELVAMMLDDWDYTQERRTLEDQTLPMAKAVLEYFDSRFARDDKGLLRITPTQAIETYWFGVENDLPCVVGLREITSRLLALPAEIGSASERQLWKRISDACPPIPMVDDPARGAKRFNIAAKFDPRRNNCENPEMMAIWPFNASGVGRGMLEEGRATYAARIEKMTHGWTQDGQQAARLGLAREAAANLQAKIRNTHKNFRFTGFWGPNFDWLPDQCHGGNLLTTTQEMLLQCVGDQIILCPALPTDWHGSFRLHAAKNTVVSATLKDGVIVSCTVEPAERAKDVVVGEGWKR